MHSPENGGPEMLMELAYRLVVEETPFIQNIRKQRDHLHHAGASRWTAARSRWTPTTSTRSAPQGEARLPLMYWGKYVAHDNNRDGMGQFLALTRNVTRTFLEWKPTILHDLHESVDLSLRLDRHRPVQRAARPDHHRRMVDRWPRTTSWR